jgi:protein arginine kinase
MGMSCSVCGAEASVLIRRKGALEAADLSLCGSCAKARGISAETGGIELSMDILLSPDEALAPSPHSCPFCGLDIVTLRRRRRISCPSCAGFFRSQIRRMHPSTLAQAAKGLPALSPTSDPAILWSFSRLGRNFADLAFPRSGSETGAGMERALELLKASGFAPRKMTDFGDAGSTILRRGEIARAWSADRDSLVATRDGLGALCLVEEDDHLVFLDSAAGLSVARLEVGLEEVAKELEESFEPAFDAEFGYLCSRVADCGRGLRSSVLLHLPALARSGLLERMLKASLAEGFDLEGFYGTSEGSAGDLWLLSRGEGSEAEAVELESAALRLAKAEDLARAEMIRKTPLEIHDLAGRALGILAYARRLSAAEALSALSDLRLGLLCRALAGLDDSAMVELLLETARTPNRGFSGGGGREGSDEQRSTALRRRLGLRELSSDYSIPLTLEGARI